MNPIVVIADDLSGAAELAGVALQFGLTAEVRTTLAGESGNNSDVVCVDTDTRANPSERAAERVEAMTRGMIPAKPAWFFKKCDSVLRGSVGEEASVMARTIGAKDILLVPANPTRGRVIRDGNYLVDGTPLHETAFARDPQHPRTSSRVRDLLTTGAIPLSIPDVATLADLDRLAATTERQTLPVGAAEFFGALLRARAASIKPERVETVAPSRSKLRQLLVCGSAYSWPERARVAAVRGISTTQVPYAIEDVIKALREAGTSLIGIGDGEPTHGIESDRLTEALADFVAKVLNTSPVDRLLLEGGATAAAVMRRMNWTRLRAQAGSNFDWTEFVPVGVTSPALIIKPGSYAWPEDLWP